MPSGVVRVSCRHRLLAKQVQDRQAAYKATKRPHNSCRWWFARLLQHQYLARGHEVPGLQNTHVRARSEPRSVQQDPVPTSRVEWFINEPANPPPQDIINNQTYRPSRRDIIFDRGNRVEGIRRNAQLTEGWLIGPWSRDRGNRASQPREAFGRTPDLSTEFASRCCEEPVHQECERPPVMSKVFAARRAPCGSPRAPDRSRAPCHRRRSHPACAHLRRTGRPGRRTDSPDAGRSPE